MKEKEEKIFLDLNGYNQILNEIEELREKLRTNKLEKGDAYEGATGDGWHDNFAFEETNRTERLLLGMLNERYNYLKKVSIIESDKDTSKIDIGDTISTKIFFSANDFDNFDFLLVGTVNNDSLKSQIPEVSINSPLGKSVYHKNIGDVTSYIVDGKSFSVEILNINKPIHSDNTCKAKIKIKE